MVKVELPYLAIYRVRGKEFAYYRRGGKRVRIRGELGSDLWRAEYERIHAGFGAPELPNLSDARPGTFAGLWRAYLLSHDFKRLARGTQAGYRRLIEPLVDDFGDLPVATLQTKHVRGWRDEMAETPRKANGMVTVLRILLAWGIEREWRKDNPAKGIKPLRYKRVPHRPWTDTEVEAMTGPEAGAGALPVLIALYTAQRLGDVLSLPWSAYDGDTITLRQSKTGAELVIPVHPILRAALDVTPRLHSVICTRPDGQPWKIDHFKHSFAAARRKLGLPDDLHFHGLRHSAASRLAEAGASHAEIASITGHKTLSMVSHYAAGARQKSLAKAAIAKLPDASQNRKVSSTFTESV